MIRIRHTLSPVVITIGLLFTLLSSTSPADVRLESIWTKHLSAPIHMAPLITRQSVITSSSNGEIHSYQRNNGKLIWAADKDIRFWDRSLILFNDLLIVGSSGGVLQALSLVNGYPVWRIELGIDVQVKPLLVDGILYVATTHVGPELSNNADGKAALFAIEANSGKRLWRKDTENYALQSPAFLDSTIYLAGSYSDPSIEIDEGGPIRVTALSSDNTKTVWEYLAIDGFVKDVYVDEKRVVYVAYQDFIIALDRKNGELVWRKDTGNWTPSLIGENGTIYYSSATTQVFAVSSVDGRLRWQFDIPRGTFNYLIGKPVIVDDRFYFLTQQGNIFALEKNSGELLWTQATGVASRTGLSVRDSTLATAGIDGGLRVYRIQPW